MGGGGLCCGDRLCGDMGFDPDGVDEAVFMAFIDTLDLPPALELPEVKLKLARSMLSLPTSFQVEGSCCCFGASAPLC